MAKFVKNISLTIPCSELGNVLGYRKDVREMNLSICKILKDSLQKSDNKTTTDQRREYKQEKLKQESSVDVRSWMRLNGVTSESDIFSSLRTVLISQDIVAMSNVPLLGPRVVLDKRFAAVRTPNDADLVFGKYFAEKRYEMNHESLCEGRVVLSLIGRPDATALSLYPDLTQWVIEIKKRHRDLKDRDPCETMAAIVQGVSYAVLAEEDINTQGLILCESFAPMNATTSKLYVKMIRSKQLLMIWNDVLMRLSVLARFIFEECIFANMADNQRTWSFDIEKYKEQLPGDCVYI